MISLDATRHASQTEWLAAGPSMVFGTVGWPSLPDDLRAAAGDASSAYWLDGGLTARVRRVARPGGAVALKKARPQALVRNRDGELSFVNELLRRRELLELTQSGHAFDGLTPTLHASLDEGVIVSPWIDGAAVESWEERALRQFFAVGIELILEGFFEWDFSPGNLLDDGRQIWLFDFGYMYRFDPLRQLNTAGNGADCPHFHLAERFESRNFFSHLLRAEQAAGPAGALPQFRLEKEVALEAYRQLRSRLAVRGADWGVLQHYDDITQDWQVALRGDLSALYLREAWHSHAADLDDDLRGKTCTPTTLTRARWLIAQVENGYDVLQASGAFGRAGQGKERAALLEELHAGLETARGHQVRTAIAGVG